MVAELAGELPEIQNRRNEIEIGANLCLSYRFAPILYRYGLSTVYGLSKPSKGIFSTIQILSFPAVYWSDRRIHD